ncbi:MAG: glycoside hydrolase family 2, partial [Acidobacteria bacterium]|nr:glycoside hydrolase family 2 [Acidobacteriota bacterium]
MTRNLLYLLVLATLCTGQETPRPEYPRPQFQREQWLSLNGRWEFEFDDRNAGLDANWGSGTRAFTRSIVVPFAFEAAKSGIGDTSFHPWVWYRRTFQVPAAWPKPGRVLLNFGAVDYRARVWVNGRFAGEHEGGNTPFQFDISPLLEKGGNVLVVRAEDPPTDRSIPRGKQYWEPKSRSIFYTRTSGIWQPVWIEAAGMSYAQRARITAGMDGHALFDLRLARCEEGCEVRVTITRDGRTEATARVPVKDSRAVASAVVQEAAPWSPASPKLYDVAYEVLREGKPVDRVQSYLGFRTVAVENGRVAINGRATYLKFV